MSHDHDHDHPHPHGHGHEHAHEHTHGGHTHSHPHDPAHPHSHDAQALYSRPRPALSNRAHLAAYKAAEKYPEGLLRLIARAKQELADEFRGITTDGVILPGLFPVKKTGVTTRPIFDAARAFLASLDDAQRSRATFDLNHDDAWRGWCNVHPFIMRHGIGLYELAPPQRDAALALVSAALSSSGFETARNVMKLNHHAGELNGRKGEYDEWYYWLSIFGTPSESAPWGWQLDGHHLIINCLVLGDQLVLTPQFMGSEPVFAQSGIYAGTQVFDVEEAKGLAMMRGLSADQQARATIGTSLPMDVVATAFRDNLTMPYEGIRHDELTSPQQEVLRDLIAVYTNRLRPGHAKIRFDEVCDHLRDTHFAWIGGHDDSAAFYYRIYNPVALIEFDHQPGIIYANETPSRDHIHTLVRTPNGNDYGKDLLRQHYAQFDHADPASAHRRGKA